MKLLEEHPPHVEFRFATRTEHGHPRQDADAEGEYRHSHERCPEPQCLLRLPCEGAVDGPAQPGVEPVLAGLVGAKEGNARHISGSVTVQLPHQGVVGTRSDTHGAFEVTIGAAGGYGNGGR